MRWIEDALLLRFITLRWVLIAWVFWATLCNPAWPLLIAVVYLLPAKLFAYLSQDELV